MTRHRFAFLAVVAALALCSRQATGSGFGLNENSARVMGMGGAFAAVADSPAAIFFNPAGLVQLKGLQVEAGMTYITPSSTYTGTAPDGTPDVEVDAERLHFFLPALHASYRIHDRVAVGFGMYVPYGLTIEWPDTVEVNGTSTAWWGRSTIRRIALQTVYFNPTVAVKLHDRVLVGAGLTIVKGAVTLERAVSMSDRVADDIQFKMSGDDVAFGATAGVLVRVLPHILNVGVAFRSGVSLTFEGNAVFTKGGSSAGVPSGLRTKLWDDEGSAELNLPHVISFGVAAFPIEGLTLGVVADLITWSSYDKLSIDFKNNNDLDTTEPKDWTNTVCVRVGAEYQVLKPLAVRLGFIYDMGPIPEDRVGPDLPDSDRYMFSVGAGYRFWKMYADLAYMYLFTGKFTASELAPLEGEYEASAHLLGLSLGLDLDI